ncbi:MAG: Na/Pi cotransporter family protein [Christensenellales bacterium]|jgi:phosphate:Na+ symporter
MDIFNFITMVGGLAMFLYGMHLLGDGLERFAGNRLRRILEQLTASPLKGILLGALVTGVIQSSSATTVMVVGFINAGIMTLRQGIGVIMGANIGTTVTAWILSLTGIRGDSFFVQMLKPSSFAPVLAIIGVGLIFFSQKNRRKDLGTILAGFAVLFFGMEVMTGAVSPLAQEPAFAQILTAFQNPILGVLTGALVTGVIQSSSASVGILQALAITGNVTYGAAIPIIMGQNIGTCVTALLSGIGANKNARRAALVHLYFNIIGTVVFLTLFYIADMIFDFNFVQAPISAMGIAVVHSLFNISGTAILAPFIKQLERLAQITIKDNETAEVFQPLDARLLNTPGIALEQSHVMASDMALTAQKALDAAISVVEDYSQESAEVVRNAEANLDKFEDNLGTYLVELSTKSLSDRDSQEISTILHTIGEFERIGDHAMKLVHVSQEMHEKKIVFSQPAQEGLKVLTSAVREIMQITTQAYVEKDVERAALVEPLEHVIDYLKRTLKDQHVSRLQTGECTIELGFIFNDLLSAYERIADHCSNVAVTLIQMRRYRLDIHRYLREVRSGDNPQFRIQYDMYLDKYKLGA